MNRARRAGSTFAGFYGKAFEDNLSGLAAMVAYNLLLAMFPLALLALFIASQVLQSQQLQESVFQDLQRLFPDAAESTLTNVLDRLRTSTTGLGILTLVVSVWICSSFWGALDTAFCRIYHMECRTWLQQRRFAMVMLVVSLLLIAATVTLPALQSIVVGGADNLPLGLSGVEELVYIVTLVGAFLVLFLILAIIYATVPRERVPWRAVWPGAAAAAVAVMVVDWAFPVYLSSISTLAGLGTSLLFIIIALIWFFVISAIILGGAEINSIRLAGGAAAARAANRGSSPGAAPLADQAAAGDGEVTADRTPAR